MDDGSHLDGLRSGTENWHDAGQVSPKESDLNQTKTSQSYPRRRLTLTDTRASGAGRGLAGQDQGGQQNGDCQNNQCHDHQRNPPLELLLVRRGSFCSCRILDCSTGRARPLRTQRLSGTRGRGRGMEIEPPTLEMAAGRKWPRGRLAHLLHLPLERRRGRIFRLSFPLP
ncbi:hypothetical protein ARZXY2_551 [Arthrobacter sp. ZXY-2]|nr:hypothetical protein ARZXY2_551 [Arthrobacter sp. ZXY-2]